jgi:hypothetical protein
MLTSLPLFKQLPKTCNNFPNFIQFKQSATAKPLEMHTVSMLICCIITFIGETLHPASYRGCSHAKEELQRRRAQWAPTEPYGRTFFSKFTSSQQPYAAALCQDKHQQPHTTQREQQYLPQKEFQKTGLSVQAPSASNNDTVATVVHQIMTKLTKAVSEEDRVWSLQNWYLT